MKNSPYLDQPAIPLAVALPWMPEKIETELPKGAAGRAKAAPKASPSDPRAGHAAAIT